ncbi:MAG: hypothetical protein FJ386_08890 [Verrucomicrobia bacterium]|nr:hypothetical protein [Verrucomicrobiota bacterium]
MNAFANRRWLAVLMLIAAIVGLLTVWREFDVFIPRMPYLTGWVLLLLMLFLTLYNGRKKLPFLPAIRSETWLQVHIYVGLFTAALFAVHLGMRMPTGWFECTLAWLYVLVMLSGIGGLFISRIFPKRLTTRGGEVLFESIPAVRRALAEQAESLALKALPAAKSATITEFYVAHLQHWFAAPRNTLAHLFEISSPLNKLLHRIGELDRFLNDEERKLMFGEEVEAGEEPKQHIPGIADLVRQKDALDYHYSLQLTLKLWLFVHIPLTYSLLVFSLVHVVLVFAFMGGTS